MARIRIDGNLIFGDEILKTGPAGEASYLFFGHGGEPDERCRSNQS